MKHLKLFAIAAPIATCTYYYTLPNSPSHHEHSLIRAPIVEAAEHDMTLRQVQVVFRHGARAPVAWSKSRFDHFINLNAEVWDQEKMRSEHPHGCDVRYTVKLPDGSAPTDVKLDEARAEVMEGGTMTGELTYVGKGMLYELGKYLSREYIEKVPLISPTFDEKDVYVRTSYYERTILSVVNLLSGLFEDGGINGVVNIETRPVQDDDLFANSKRSKIWGAHMRQVFDGVFKSPEELEFEKHLNKYFGLTDDKYYIYITQFNDLIRCRKAHGLPVGQYLLDNEELISKYEETFTDIIFGKGDSRIIKACIGSFLNTLCLRLEEAVEGRSSYKMFLYSGHDWTIIPLMNALQVNLEEWPQFAAYIILELYERSDGEMFVKLLYNDRPVQMGSDGDFGTGFIPVQKFLKMVEDYGVREKDVEE